MFSVLTLLNFLHHHGGVAGFSQLMERLADPDRSEGDIARSLDMAPSQFSRMINQWTVDVRVPRKDVLDFVQTYGSIERGNLERQARIYPLAGQATEK